MLPRRSSPTSPPAGQVALWYVLMSSLSLPPPFDARRRLAETSSDECVYRFAPTLRRHATLLAPLPARTQRSSPFSPPVASLPCYPQYTPSLQSFCPTSSGLYVYRSPHSDFARFASRIPPRSRLSRSSCTFSMSHQAAALTSFADFSLNANARGKSRSASCQMLLRSPLKFCPIASACIAPAVLHCRYSRAPAQNTYNSRRNSLGRATSRKSTASAFRPC